MKKFIALSALTSFFVFVFIYTSICLGSFWQALGLHVGAIALIALLSWAVIVAFE